MVDAGGSVIVAGQSLVFFQVWQVNSSTFLPD